MHCAHRLVTAYIPSLPPSLLILHERYLKLPNELKALLISDTTTEKAAAALSVHVGELYRQRELDFQCLSVHVFSVCRNKCVPPLPYYCVADPMSLIEK